MLMKFFKPGRNRLKPDLPEKCYIAFYAVLFLLLISLSIGAQTHDPTVIRFVNTGKMHVAANGINTSLFIPDAVLTDGQSSIVQNGTTAIGGNFYQNAQSTAFTLGTDGFTVGGGTVRFMSESLSSKQRQIAVWRGNTNNPVAVPARYTTNDPAAPSFFSREENYVAFPNIEIATNDEIRLEPIMGIDAINITRTSATGRLYLESEPVGASSVFNASLRVTGSTVDLGTVIVEKHILPFRREEDGNNYLYPFASPYTNLRAGYFAGNWVRSPLADGNGHYAYPYANMKSQNGDYIDESQYMRSALDVLTVGAPYLIRLRPSGHEYDHPFILTGESEHDLDKFILDGNMHGLDFTAKQKMTGTLYNRAPAAAGTKYQWLIGNSYTAALSIESLTEAIANSATVFSSNLYIYPHGATTYEAYDLVNDAGKIPDIPAMSIFMLIVSSGNANTSESFVITPRMQVHGGSIGADWGTTEIQAANELVFRLTPQDNPHIYDRTRIVLQEDLPLDAPISKTIDPAGDYFQLYGGSEEQALEKNVLPENTEQTPLLVSPPKNATDCRLTVSGVETLTTETLLLHDKKTNVWTDLKQSEDYVFQTNPEDSPERFTLYFQIPTNIKEVDTSAVYAYCQDGYLFLNRLTEADLGASLKIYNAAGILIQETRVDSYPQYSTPATMPQGVYMAKLTGKDNKVFKFLKR